MFEVIHGGNSIPPKVWLKATDIAAEYARCGEAFVSAGRPTDGPVADLFSSVPSSVPLIWRRSMSTLTRSASISCTT